MTKVQWMVHWREERIKQHRADAILWEQRKNLINYGSILKELYDHIYLPKQDAFIRLVNKYQAKLSSDFLLKAEQLIESWEPEARSRSRESYGNLVYSKNPFLELINKDNHFLGQYYPIPLIYENDGL